MKRVSYSSEWMKIEERDETVSVSAPDTGEIVNKALKVVEIDIEGTIGGDFWGEDDAENINTKEKMRRELKNLAELKADKIIVNINSLGGSFNHGISIHDLLAQSRAEITTRITGMTASAATIIGQAGGIRQISDNALILIHRASYTILAQMNQNELKNLVGDLETVDNKLLDIYQKRTGAERDKLEELLDSQNGTGRWLTAQEAKDYGLVDEIFEPMKVAAMVTKEQLIKNKLPIPINMKEEVKNDGQSIVDQIKTFIHDTFGGKDKEMVTTEPPQNTDEPQPEVVEPEGVTGETMEPVNKQEDIQVREMLNAMIAENEKANAKIKELENALLKTQATSTKVTSAQGLEDKDSMNPENPEDQSLGFDLSMLRAELSKPRLDNYNLNN